MGSSILIGISGKKQSGKSTLCDFIRGWHWFEFARRNEGYCVLQDVDGSLRVIKSETETELEDIDIATEVQFANLVAIYNFADTLKETCMKEDNDKVVVHMLFCGCCKDCANECFKCFFF